MGYKLLQTCIDCDLTGLTDGEWRTLLVICRHADDVTGGNCHPSTQTICKKSRLTEKVVRKAIQRLEANGWIRTSQNPGAVRFFEVDVAKINACLPLVSAKEHPRAEVRGGAKEHPRAEVTDNPVQKCTPTPCKSAPLREQLKEQEENSIVNDVYGKQGLPSTTITATVNDVYGKGKRRLPITDKEQTKNRQVLIGDFHPRVEVQETTSRCAGSCTADVQEPAHRREHIKEQEENSNYSRDLFDDSDQKANRGAAKTEKTQRNSLIQKENRGAPLMVPSPADSANEIASKSLIQKENEGADTPARTSVKKAAKKEPQGSRLTLEELPDEWYFECRRIQPKADPHKVFEEFRDHWISQPGAKGRKSDWTATWRNWCRRINARDLERVGYEPGRAQFMVKPEPVNPFKVTPQNCPLRQKTEEEQEAERSFDLFERVLNGEV